MVAQRPRVQCQARINDLPLDDYLIAEAEGYIADGDWEGAQNVIAKLKGLFPNRYSEVDRLSGSLPVAIGPSVAKPMPSVVRPPGYAFLNAVRVAFGIKVADRVFAQTVRDLNEEYIEALAANQLRLARWIRIRGMIVLVHTVVIQAWVSTLKRVVEIWKAVL